VRICEDLNGDLNSRREWVNEQVACCCQKILTYLLGAKRRKS
jgi:hypothetical protein